MKKALCIFLMSYLLAVLSCQSTPVFQDTFSSLAEMESRYADFEKTKDDYDAFQKIVANMADDSLFDPEKDKTEPYIGFYMNDIIKSDDIFQKLEDNRLLKKDIPITPYNKHKIVTYRNKIVIAYNDLQGEDQERTKIVRSITLNNNNPDEEQFKKALEADSEYNDLKEKIYTSKQEAWDAKIKEILKDESYADFMERNKNYQAMKKDYDKKNYSAFLKQTGNKYFVALVTKYEPYIKNEFVQKALQNLSENYWKSYFDGIEEQQKSLEAAAKDPIFKPYLSQDGSTIDQEKVTEELLKKFSETAKKRRKLIEAEKAFLQYLNDKMYTDVSNAQKQIEKLKTIEWNRLKKMYGLQTETEQAILNKAKEEYNKVQIALEQLEKIVQEKQSKPKSDIDNTKGVKK
jgi:hypothetical protein